MQLANYPKVNPTPRISLNKLGEYLSCKPGRRRTILKSQKYPKDAIIARNTDFYNALFTSVEAGSINVDSILDNILRLKRSANGNKWHDENLELNTKLLRHLLAIQTQFDRDDLTLTTASGPHEHLNIEGVSVSVRPELLIHGSRRGEAVFGGVKFHLPKSNSLEGEAGDYAATVLKSHLDVVCPKGSIVKNELCFVVDLPVETVHTAPKAYKKRWFDIEAACFEISNQWNAIKS